MNEIIIVGNGKLSTSLIDRFPLYSTIPIQKYHRDLAISDETIFVHIGSGRQFHESLKLVKDNNATFIQSATEKDIKMERPIAGTFKYINAPNLDLNIVRLFYWLSLTNDLFSGEKISITESHQKEKTSDAGTAIKISNYLKVPQDRIISIRDPRVQKDLDISNLHQHAYHKVEVGDKNSSVTIETKIEGSESYIKGLARIVEASVKLKTGNYEVEDLIKLKFL